MSQVDTTSTWFPQYPRVAENALLLSNTVPKGSNSLILAVPCVTRGREIASASRQYEVHTSGLLGRQLLLFAEPDLRLTPEQV